MEVAGITDEEYDQLCELTQEEWEQLTDKWTKEQWQEYWSKYYDRCVSYDGGWFQILWDGVHLIRYWRHDHYPRGYGKDFHCETQKTEIIFQEPRNSWQAALQVIAWQKYREDNERRKTETSTSEDASRRE